MTKLDSSEVEPKEPEEGRNLMVGPNELNIEEEWCSEQLYQLMVQKCEGPALDIIRKQNTRGKARGGVGILTYVYIIIYNITIIYNNL